ncbi:protein GAMETOPHYTE DEFECTIVE 1-like [Trifolium pratense]|uniref:protein GAMETOPHYTE DEFECTIVE 1-like n=1 Tax=Trifolium pratense TaxID=57577 RepID=UPI001E691911|nr:protein GAMETOPHYTE DEFECTIVE 1-like [Trifolium pratense]
MGFFDLNIPYPETTTKSEKSTIENNRIKLAVKAMELGYTGIAYNRTMKGIMSDNNRCSISPLSLSSLLNVVPFLSSSAKLHRELLGVPSSTPFRQYTRLTVCVENHLQANALNAGNPILKTYDLVAVKPLNQTVFDIACERMAVDIISIDFSAKLPFRLKQAMVKMAIQRGVVFEVSYSGLIANVQLRRQLISNAKLLIDWTRGRDIVFSSAAPSVNELRGPCDVSNLLLLFGLSKEEAKAAISKNCRVLLSNALRRKQFHKEAIRVEVLSLNIASHSKEARHQELLKWDPISSGKGDILLDDMENSGPTSCKASKTIKAIDFDSVLDSLPSQGCQLKDFLPANDAFSIFSTNKVNFVSVAKNVNQSTPVPNTLTEQPNRPDICPEQDGRSSLEGITKPHIVRCDNFFEKVINSGTTEAFHSNEIETNDAKLELENSIDSDVQMDDTEKPLTAFCKASDIAQATVDSYNNGNLLPVAEIVNQSKPVPNNSTEQPDKLNLSPEQKERLSDTVTTHHNVSCDNVFEENIHIGTIESFNSNVEIDTQTNGTELGLQNFIESDVDCIPFEAKTLDSHPVLCNSSNNILDTVKAHGNEKLLKSLDDPHNIDGKVEIFTPSRGISFPAPLHEKHKEKNTDVTLNAHLSTMHENLPKEDLKIAEHTVMDMNTSTSETSVEDGPFNKRETDAVEVDEMPHQTPFDEMKTEDDSTVAIHSSPEVIMEDKKFGEVSTDSDQFASAQSVSGRLRVKRRTSPLLFPPLKRLLNMVPFKKKGKKVKRRTNPK